MKKRIIMLFSILLLMILLFSACSSGSSSENSAEQEKSASEKVVEINIAAGGSDIGFYEIWADLVNETCEGKLVMNVYDQDSLGSSADVLATVRDGSFDAMQVNPSIVDNDFPVMEVVEIPFLMGSPTTTTEVAYALLNDNYLNEITDDFHLLFFHATDMQRIAFASKKVTKPADLNGMIFRCMAEGGVTMLKSLGATGTAIAPPETYMSLETGIVDGSISSPTAMVVFSYHEVCDYLLDLPLYASVNMAIMNKDVWNSIPGELQQKITECSEWAHYTYIYRNYTNEMAAVKTLTEGGMEVIKASSEMKAAVSEVTEQMTAAYTSQLKKLGYDSDAILEVVNNTIDRCEYEF